MRRGMDEKCHGTTWRRDATNATGNQCLMCKVSFRICRTWCGLGCSPPRLEFYLSTGEEGTIYISSPPVTSYCPSHLLPLIWMRRHLGKRRQDKMQSSRSRKNLRNLCPISQWVSSISCLMMRNPGHSFAVPAKTKIWTLKVWRQRRMSLVSVIG